MALKPYMSSTKILSLLSFLLFILLSLNVNAQLSTIQPGELCGEDNNPKEFDLSPLRDLPWKLSSKNFTQTFDILTCGVFDDTNLAPAVECKNSSICHKIDGKFIGFKPIGFQKFSQYSFWRVRYMGPSCKFHPNINYSLEINFRCGEHLGYPVFPPYKMVNSCTTILHWETSAVCPKKTESPEENQCYVIDSNGARRDLTPLIKTYDDYKVQSPHKDVRINVCTEAKSCPKSAAVCILDENKKIKTMGSNRYSSLRYVPKERNSSNYDFIELTYKGKNRECVNADGTQAITTVRFICPNSLVGVPALKRHPVLMSDIECRYQIDWITEHACPQDDIEETNKNCSFSKFGLDLLGLRKENDTHISNEHEDIYINLCDNVKYQNCGKQKSICILPKNNTFPSIDASHISSKLIKKDGGFHLQYKILKGCILNGTNQDYNFNFNLECGNATDNPQLISSNECDYEFVLKTNVVCEKFQEPIDCQFRLNSNTIYDLSSLTRPAGRAKDMHKAIKKQSIDSSYLNPNQEVLINICAPIGKVTDKIDCGMASACLVDYKANTSKSLGVFNRDFVFDEDNSNLKITYTNGHNNSSALINFYCTKQSQKEEIEIYQNDNTNENNININEQKTDMSFIFKTSAACPIEEIDGKDCEINVPGVGIVNLKSLKADKYYSISNSSYEYLINVCGPIKDDRCGEDVAICQKEKNGQKRIFSLGQYSTNILKHWNDIVNMTFVGGTKYNDPKRTPRKSHISFICNPTAGRGEPEFASEQNQVYHFEWQTSIVCPVQLPEAFDCSWHNETNFFDLNPLQMDKGNHHSVNEKEKILFMNFCRGLNPMKNVPNTCRTDNGACVVKFGKYTQTVLNLGRPVDQPFKFLNDDIFLFLNNGDQCPNNPSLNITTTIHLKCDRQINRQLDIQLFEPEEVSEDVLLRNGDGSEDVCNYKIIVSSKYACLSTFDDVKLKNCVYTDPRTKFVVNLNDLSHAYEKSSRIMNKSSEYLLNVCGNVKFDDDETNVCKESAVCFKDSNGSFINFGIQNDPKVYFEGKNFHVRFIGSSECNHVGHKYWSDIEFQCDPNEHYSKPTLVFRDKCVAKFVWKTSLVCHLGPAACSLIDPETNSFYSLSPLSTKSNLWSIKNSNIEHFLLNICQPIQPSKCSGIQGSAACKCQTNNDMTVCHNIGQVSDHELILDPVSKDLILRYEDGDTICNGSIASTQINFRCSKEQTGFSGPQYNQMTKHCDHYFIWDTIFACPIRFDQTYLSFFPENFSLSNPDKPAYWNISELLTGQARSVIEHRKIAKTELDEIYSYQFNFNKTTNHDQSDVCADAAICQTKDDQFKRNIGTKNVQKWSFNYLGDNILLTIPSSNSKCGTSKNSQLYASTKISFECSYGPEELNFVHENHDCEYYFVWKTDKICDAQSIAYSSDGIVNNKGDGLGAGWTFFTILLFATIIFVVWITVSKSTTRDNVVFRIRKIFRRNQQPEIPFRYQQSEEEGILLTAQV